MFVLLAIPGRREQMWAGQVVVRSTACGLPLKSDHAVVERRVVVDNEMQQRIDGVCCPLLDYTLAGTSGTLT